MKPNHGLDRGTMGAVHTITLRGGPHHAETRHVPEPPRFKETGFGINGYGPQHYYAFHRRSDGEWEPTAIYIQDPVTPALFHFHAYAKDT